MLGFDPSSSELADANSLLCPTSPTHSVDDRISDLLRKIGFEAAGNVISEDFIVSEINKELTSSDRDALNNLGAGDKESVINEVRKFADIFRHILVREDESGVDQAASTGECFMS